MHETQVPPTKKLLFSGSCVTARAAILSAALARHLGCPTAIYLLYCSLTISTYVVLSPALYDRYMDAMVMPLATLLLMLIVPNPEDFHGRLWSSSTSVRPRDFLRVIKLQMHMSLRAAVSALIPGCIRKVTRMSHVCDTASHLLAQHLIALCCAPAQLQKRPHRETRLYVSGTIRWCKSPVMRCLESHTVWAEPSTSFTKQTSSKCYRSSSIIVSQASPSTSRPCTCRAQQQHFNKAFSSSRPSKPSRSRTVSCRAGEETDQKETLTQLSQDDRIKQTLAGLDAILGIEEDEKKEREKATENQACTQASPQAMTSASSWRVYRESPCSVCRTARKPGQMTVSTSASVRK